jgi:hypothetical protein
MGGEQLQPIGGAPPFWGLNDKGKSSSNAPLFWTDPWDTFTASGFQFTGQCIVTGVGPCHQYESKKARGSSGSGLTVEGYKPMPFEVMNVIETEDQWDVFCQLRTLLFSKLTAKTPAYKLAINVEHPELHSADIYRAVLLGVSLSSEGPVDGAKTFKWTFHDYFPPTAANQTKSPSTKGPKEFTGLPSSFQAGGSSVPIPPSSNPANASILGAPVSE